MSEWGTQYGDWLTETDRPELVGQRVIVTVGWADGRGGRIVAADNGSLLILIDDADTAIPCCDSIFMESPP